MSARIVVVTVAPALDRNGHRLAAAFHAIVDGATIAGTTRTPFCDAARALLKLGYPADARLLMQHAGSSTTALRSTIGAAARLTVKETGNGPRFAPWTAFFPSPVTSPVSFSREEEETSIPPTVIAERRR